MEVEEPRFGEAASGGVELEGAEDDILPRAGGRVPVRRRTTVTWEF
jgi:hypothetical protein